MSKKKRNKAYKGSGAAVARPTITRMNAIKRNPVHQWWVDNKRIARPVLLVSGVVGVIILSVIGIISIIW